MIYLNMIRLTDYEIQNPVLLEPQVYKFSLPTMLKCFRMHRADFKKIGMSLQNFQHVACFSCMFGVRRQFCPRKSPALTCNPVNFCRAFPGNAQHWRANDVTLHPSPQDTMIIP